jgi:hypothetical protein
MPNVKRHLSSAFGSDMSSQTHNKTMCHTVPQTAAYQQSAGSVTVLLLAASASLQNSAPQFHHHLPDNSGPLIWKQNHISKCKIVGDIINTHDLPLACLRFIFWPADKLSWGFPWSSSVHSHKFEEYLNLDLPRQTSLSQYIYSRILLNQHPQDQTDARLSNFLNYQTVPTLT